MGKVIAVCTSDRKGLQKHNVNTAHFSAEWGIDGDAHAGKWHRQISLLSADKIEAFNKRGANVIPGAFGENLVVEGFDFRALPVGALQRCAAGNDADRQGMPHPLRDIQENGRVHHAA